MPMVPRSSSAGGRWRSWTPWRHGVPEWKSKRSTSRTLPPSRPVRYASLGDIRTSRRLSNNAGIQQIVDFTQGEAHDPSILAREIDINLKGLVLVSNAFLPLLKRQPSARLIHIGSGLGFVPLAAAPVYSATKAAVHSFTISLRQQLRASSVKVIEIIPPVVETELHAGQTRKPPGAMPLHAFVKASMAGLKSGREEIPVGLARVLKIAARIAPGLFLKIINKPRG